MSPARIPIARAREVGKAHPDVRQVILIAWDGQRTHVVTWGRTVEDCDMAAAGGNQLKKSWGWPENLRAEPSRVAALKKRVAIAAQMLAALELAEGALAVRSSLRDGEQARVQAALETVRQVLRVARAEGAKVPS